MKRDGRLSLALHALLHLGEAGTALTSEVLAGAMRVHPVVLRRTMAGLREARIVRAEKGRGGGFALARPLAEVTLAEVYEALGVVELFALGARTESPGCLVEQAVNRAMGRALDAAEAAMHRELGRVTLQDLAADIGRPLRGKGKGKGHGGHARKEAQSCKT